MIIGFRSSKNQDPIQSNLRGTVQPESNNVALKNYYKKKVWYLYMGVSKTGF
jgi:hypothetical protein